MSLSQEPTSPLVAIGGERTLADVYKEIGLGFYQWRLFVIAGLGFMADSIEVGVITFLEKEVEKVWEISGFEKNCLAIAVFAGEFAGCFVWGPLADRIGRKKAFIISNFALLFLGCLSAAAPNFWSLVAMRCLVGISIGGIVVPFDNLLESVSEEDQAKLGYAMEFWWTLGTLFVNGLAAVVIPADFGGVASWRIFVLLSAAPILLVCIGGFIVDESPTWLQDVGCNDEALEIVQKVARTNGKDITGVRLMPYEREEEPSMTVLFTANLRRRTLSLSAIWLLGLFGYYGAALANSFIFDDFNEDKINYGELLFASSGEIVGVIVSMIMVRYMSGMWVLGICYEIAAVACVGILITASFPTDAVPKAIVACLAFVLRLGCMGGSSAVWVVTPPAYPTYVRSTAHSMLFGAGRIGGLLATAVPADTPVMVVMGVYAVANCVCGVIGMCEGRSLEDKGVFETLGTDLNATDIDRRVRSMSSHQSRSMSGTTGRPSLFSTTPGRPSAASMGRPSMTVGTPSAREVSQPNNNA